MRFMEAEKKTQSIVTMKRINIVHEEEDRISWLPDCLLIEILFRLDSTKDDIKASSLSKRWRHLWTQVPNLAFHQSGLSLDKLYGCIEKTLSQCEHQSNLARFKLELYYYDDIELNSKLNRWIRYVLNRNVQEIDLGLYKILEAPFVLDQLIFNNSCFTHLKFKGCRLNPTGAISWKNLKSLSFSNKKLDEGVIQNILSGSPLLETFKLVLCYGFRRLDITSKSVKNLVFSGYLNRENYMSEHFIIINAPYISSLTIREKLVIKKLLLTNLTSLFEANLNFWMGWVIKSEVEEMLKCVLLNLQHVKEIKIGNICQETLFRLEAKGFTRPANVKYVHWLDLLD